MANFKRCNRTELNNKGSHTEPPDLIIACWHFGVYYFM